MGARHAGDKHQEHHKVDADEDQQQPDAGETLWHLYSPQLPLGGMIHESRRPRIRADYVEISCISASGSSSGKPAGSGGTAAEGVRRLTKVEESE